MHARACACACAQERGFVRQKNSLWAVGSSHRTGSGRQIAATQTRTHACARARERVGVRASYAVGSRAESGYRFRSIDCCNAHMHACVRVHKRDSLCARCAWSGFVRVLLRSIDCCNARVHAREGARELSQGRNALQPIVSTHARTPTRLRAR